MLFYIFFTRILLPYIHAPHTLTHTRTTANIKQVLTILLSVSLFSLTITPPNAAGIALTLVGGAWYAAVQYREKKKKGGAR